jgi:tetratricopeptide (TPR) repeat protein
MLPLGEDAAAKDIQKKTKGMISRLLIPPPGKSEVDLSEVQARIMLQELLASINYQAPEDCLGDIKDLRSDERIHLLFDMATSLANLYRQWKQGQVQSVLDMWPAQELCRCSWRKQSRDWPSRWSAAGGKFFPGKSDYPQGRMIALKDDPIWEVISAFGVPFPPFDLQSGMGVRDIKRHEAVALGLIKDADGAPQRVLLRERDFEEFKKRLAVKLRESVAKLEEDDEKRLADPINFGTGYDLLDLAEDKIGESEQLTPDQVHEIKSIVEKALERGFGCTSDWPAKVYRSLSLIYGSIKEPEKAVSYQQKATELEVSSLLSRATSYELINYAEKLLAGADKPTSEITKHILGLIGQAFEKGIGEKYNLRAKAHRVLAKLYERIQDLKKAEANRLEYVENADGFLLLEDAKKELTAIDNKTEPEASARILDMLSKAVQRLPENLPHLHAEAYRASAEILESLGDNVHAVEHYEYALLKNPRIGVKRRLDALRKLSPTSNSESGNGVDSD